MTDRTLLKLMLPVIAAGLAAFPACAAAAWSGKEGRIALTIDRENLPEPYESRIVTVEPDGSSPIVVHTCPPMLGENSCTSPDTGAVAWSPDGRRLAVVIGTRIAVVNADGTGWHFITGGDAFSREPAWSPDGRRIAYIRLSQPGATKSALVSVNSSDGGGLRHLTAAVGIDDVAWSSRNQVAYVQGQHIFSTDSAGRHRRRLATNLDPRYIDWGPDGKRLLFSGENTRVAPGADGRYGTWSVTRDGKHQKFQAPELINSLWSPTGRHIASSGDDTFKLSRLNGSGLKIVTPDYPAAWGRAKLQAWQSVAP